jgi:hypothetical protein
MVKSLRFPLCSWLGCRFAVDDPDERSKDGIRSVLN